LGFFFSCKERVLEPLVGESDIFKPNYRQGNKTDREKEKENFELMWRSWCLVGAFAALLVQL